MNPIILIIEDSELHLKTICELILNQSINEESLNKLNINGFIKIESIKPFSKDEYDLYIVNNRDNAGQIISEYSNRILFCMLDLILPEDITNKEDTTKIHGMNLLENLQKKDIFTFIISVDKDSLKDIFTESKIVTVKENTQFIYKNFLTDDKYLAEFYSKLIIEFIKFQIQSIRWNLIIILGYFQGLDHIAELYENFSQGSKDKIISKQELNAKSNGDYINVKTEFHPLQNVLLHKPGKEVEKVTPTNANDLLFDQPVDYNKFLNQYKTFITILENITEINGGEVFYVENLLNDIFEEIEYGAYNRCLFILSLIQKGIIHLEEFWDIISYSTEKIIELAIAGNEDLDPIPNFMFMRDNIVTVHNLIFLPTMTKKARKRENALMEFILLNHSCFRQSYAKDFSITGDNSFEGGDFILVDEETVFIGISDRTTIGSVREFAKYVFQKNNVIQTIVGIGATLQHERSMHLDTYMGVIGDYILILDEPLVTSKDNTFYVFDRNAEESENYPKIFLGNFKSLLQKISKSEKFEVIAVSEKREAYDDACNVLSLGHNQIVTYNRGKETIIELGKRGFVRIIYNSEKGKHPVWERYRYEGDWIHKGDSIDLEDFYKRNEKYVFEIEGSELIQARGGCHCMSMPLLRLHEN